jgi:dsDNA-specific endonuclease/ATPase MutS2
MCGGCVAMKHWRKYSQFLDEAVMAESKDLTILHGKGMEY